MRKGITEAEPRSWNVTANTLDIVQHGQSYKIPLEKLTEVRLRFEPGRFATNRCIAEVVTNTAWNAEIDNQHWAGVADFEDRSLTYRLMIEALLARLQQANPAAQLVTGQGAALWLMSGFVLVMLVALFFVVLTIGGPLIALLKLGLLAFFVPGMVRYLRINQRQRLPISAPPPDGVLPRLTG